MIATFFSFPLSLASVLSRVLLLVTCYTDRPVLPLELSTISGGISSSASTAATAAPESLLDADDARGVLEDEELCA